MLMSFRWTGRLVESWNRIPPLLDYPCSSTKSERAASRSASLPSHCMGALPPHDHPHVYLNMSEQNDILCPYCSTEFRLNRSLRWNATIPANCWGDPRA